MAPHVPSPRVSGERAQDSTNKLVRVRGATSCPSPQPSPRSARFRGRSRGEGAHRVGRTFAYPHDEHRRPVRCRHTHWRSALRLLRPTRYTKVEPTLEEIAMTKTLTALVAAMTLAIAASAVPRAAEARCVGCAGGE